MKALATVSLVVTYVSAFVPWGFVILYHRLSRGAWRLERMGWHVMILTIVDALIFTMLASANIWPTLATYPWYQWSYVGTVAGIPAVTAWRGWITWRLYHPRLPVAGRPPV